MNVKHDGIKKPSKEETYSRDPSPYKIEPLSYRPGDLRDPRTFPHCSRAASSRYSVPAGPSRGARHFLLLVSNMGQFPKLTPVHRQTTEAWLPTPGASDSWCTCPCPFPSTLPTCTLTPHHCLSCHRHQAHVCACIPLLTLRTAAPPLLFPHWYTTASSKSIGHPATVSVKLLCWHLVDEFAV